MTFVSVFLLSAPLAVLPVTLRSCNNVDFNQRQLVEAQARRRVGTGSLSDELNFEIRVNAANTTVVVGENNYRIALIGLRGAGKSTLGKALAERLGVPFIQLDRAVEQEAGMQLTEIFDLLGQSAFRRLERQVLERVIEAHDTAVIDIVNLL